MRAVGHPQVVQSVLAERGAQHIEITCRIGGRHVLEESLDRGSALEDGARTLQPGHLSGSVGRAIDGDQPVEVGIAGAVDRS